MTMKKTERWRELCAQAAVERDPNRLMELVREITLLFDQEHPKHISEQRADGSWRSEGQVEQAED